MPEENTNKIREVHVSELNLDPRNPRKRTELSAGVIKKSLEQFGACRSIVIDESGTVRADNGTLQEASQLGIEKVIIVEATGNELVAVRRAGLTDEQWKQYAVADNTASDFSGWDENILTEISQEVDLSDFFPEDKLSEILNQAAEPSIEEQKSREEREEDLDEINVIESRVKLGEIWELGRHRICCGDSTISKNVEELLDDRLSSVKMVWADPPYGISIVATNGYIGGGEAYGIPFGGIKNETPEQRQKRLEKKWFGTVGGSKPFGSKDVRGTDSASNIVEVNKYVPIIGDDTTDTARKSFEICFALNDAIQFWWGANYYDFLPASSCWIVWDKENTGNFADAELAWCNHPSAVRMFKHMWNGMIKASEHGEKRVHPTQKPIALCEWVFGKYGQPDDLIFDPFLGSAPSIIAAEKMEGNRRVFGFELSPDYCEVIIQRWEKFTGDTAKLIGKIE